jgi:hypothetical protein
MFLVRRVTAPLFWKPRAGLGRPVALRTVGCVSLTAYSRMSMRAASIVPLNGFAIVTPRNSSFTVATSGPAERIVFRVFAADVTRDG